MNINQLSWGSVPSRTLSHGTLLSQKTQIFEEDKVCFPKVQDGEPAFYLPPSPQHPEEDTPDTVAYI